MRRPHWRCLFSIFLAGNVSATTAPDLFTEVFDASQPTPPRALSTFPVAINFDALAKNPASLSIQLPGSGTYTATRTRFEALPAGRYHWIGKTPLHDVVLTIQSNLITGFIRGASDTYSVISSLDGGGASSQSLQRMDSEAFPDDIVYEDGPPNVALETTKGATLAIPEGRCLGTDDEPIDLLVVYSPQALAASGGDASVLENEIHNAVASANVTISNSDVPALLQLVRIEPAPATLIEVGSPSDLAAALDNVDLIQLRSLWKADVVTYITSLGINGSTPYCGVTRTMRREGAFGYGYDFAPSAVNVVTWQCGIQNNDLSHEIGHNLGLNHNPGFTASTPTANLYPFAFGHHLNGFFRDDMSGISANSCPDGCPRQMFFSNPDQVFFGQDRGVQGARDNAQTYRRMFRCVNTFADFVFGDGME